jgi:hypothetical protein
MVRARANGRRIEAADAWIAATALLYGAALVTHNPKDYLGVPNLHVLKLCVSFEWIAVRSHWRPSVDHLGKTPVTLEPIAAKPESSKAQSRPWPGVGQAPRSIPKETSPVSPLSPRLINR